MSIVDSRENTVASDHVPLGISLFPPGIVIGSGSETTEAEARHRGEEERQAEEARRIAELPRAQVFIAVREAVSSTRELRDWLGTNPILATGLKNYYRNIAKYLERLGAKWVVMSKSDARQAMERGIVDGVVTFNESTFDMMLPYAQSGLVLGSHSDFSEDFVVIRSLYN